MCITVCQTVTICEKKSFFPSSLPEVKPTLYPLPLYPASTDIRGGDLESVAGTSNKDLESRRSLWNLGYVPSLLEMQLLFWLSTPSLHPHIPGISASFGSFCSEFGGMLRYTA